MDVLDGYPHRFTIKVIISYPLYEIVLQQSVLGETSCSESLSVALSHPLAQNIVPSAGISEELSPPCSKAYMVNFKHEDSVKS